jgi:hypothetical protein
MSKYQVIMYMQKKKLFFFYFKNSIFFGFLKTCVHQDPGSDSHFRITKVIYQITQYIGGNGEHISADRRFRIIKDKFLAYM